MTVKLIEALLLIAFVALQTVDGRVVYVNSEFVVSLGTVPGGSKTFAEKVNCVVNLVNAKFVTVAEDCAAVRRRLEDR